MIKNDKKQESFYIYYIHVKVKETVYYDRRLKWHVFLFVFNLVWGCARNFSHSEGGGVHTTFSSEKCKK